MKKSLPSQALLLLSLFISDLVISNEKDARIILDWTISRSTSRHVTSPFLNIVILHVKLEEYGGAHICLLLNKVAVRLHRQNGPIVVADYGLTEMVILPAPRLTPPTDLRLVQDWLHLDALSQVSSCVFLLVVLLVQNHTRQCWVDPAGPLVEAFMIPLALSK